MLEQVLFKIL